MTVRTYKVGFYCVSPLTKMDFILKLQRFLGDHLLGKALHQFHVEVSDPYEWWAADVPENEANCDLSLLEKRFPAVTMPKEGLQEIIVGRVYQHFKGHEVRVLAISRDTEHPSQLSVVYEHIGTGVVWNRPLAMFASKVDRKKYPDVKQEYRFELVVDK